MKSLGNQWEKLHPQMKWIMKLLLVLAISAAIWYCFMSRSIFFFRKPIYIPILGGLNNYDVVLNVGDTYHLYIFGVNKRVSFQSTDMKVATVNLIGTVRAWRPGTTIINVRYEDKRLQCRVRVVKLNKEKMTLHIGDTKRLYVKNVLIGVKYSSDNRSVATVNRFGYVKAIGEGTATITVTYRGKKLTCKVIVSK